MHAEKRLQILKDHDLTDQQDFIFVEITVADPSEFATELNVKGHVRHQQYRVLTVQSATVPNASPRSCCTSETKPADNHTSTSSGPKATRPSTSSAS